MELTKRMRLVDETNSSEANLIEVYPGAAWPVFSTHRLSKKTTVKGRVERRELLEAQGLRFHDESVPSHDELDAAIAAYTAWLFKNGNSQLVGESPFVEHDILREGFIVQPAVA